MLFNQKEFIANKNAEELEPFERIIVEICAIEEKRHIMKEDDYIRLIEIKIDSLKHSLGISEIHKIGERALEFLESIEIMSEYEIEPCELPDEW